MAYLKGDTYVDGSLYVDGALIVKKLSDTSGIDLPYLESTTAAKPNYIVKFFTNDGGITSSNLREEVDIENQSLIYTVDAPDGINTVILNSGNLGITVEEAPYISFESESSNVTVNTEELIGLIKEGSKVTNSSGATVTATISTGDKYYTFNGERYTVIKEKPEDFGNKPWFEPTLFCYSSELKTA